MTVSALQTTLVSQDEGYHHAKAQLAAAAARLGLELVGWGAVPSDPPKVKIEKDGSWLCPHCGVISEDLGVVFISDQQVFASPVTAETEDQDDRDELAEFGREDVKAPYWRVSEPDALAENSDRVGYCCTDCCGWVEPDNDVVVTY